MSASVDVVIPVYNEEDALPVSIPRLCAFLGENLANPWRVTIADNASIDGTRAVSEELSREIDSVNYLYLPEKGRGRALRAAWLGSECDIVSYMDVDLSTDLSHFPQLVASLESGCHVAIGSRLSKESRVTQRSFKREIHVARLQQADLVDVLRGVSGRPVRIQGNDATGGAGHHPPRQEQQLVLRH